MIDGCFPPKVGWKIDSVNNALPRKMTAGTTLSVPPARCGIYFLIALRMLLARAARSPSGSSVRNFSNIFAALSLSALLRYT